MAHDHDLPVVSPVVGRVLIGVLVIIGTGALVGLVVWWPSGRAPRISQALAGPPFVDATVISVSPGPCAGTTASMRVSCNQVILRVTSGRPKGRLGSIEQSIHDPFTPRLKQGDRVVLGYTADAPPEAQYYFADFQRRTPLIALAVCFVVAVLVVGHRYGLQAIAGLVASMVVLIGFLLPALERGASPVGSALVATTLVAFVALFLAHGFNLRSAVALLGTLAALALTVVLGLVFVAAARLTGLSDENIQFLQVTPGRIDARGLLLAGMVVGALGVLTDVTVTQVSVVSELVRSGSAHSVRHLYRSGLRVGRDHISATVNTLVLAYAGAALPLLLLFSEGTRPISRVLTSETVAIEIVRTLVGSIGLVAAVPITTLLAAVVLARPDDAPESTVSITSSSSQPETSK